ncbi:hypothetical protein [Nannocystis pusilla]|uniref:hypothetical protein n=1 Tax=Nannocystis pusilla TaxID=889268 RepID=UPI003B79C0A0
MIQRFDAVVVVVVDERDDLPLGDPRLDDGVIAIEAEGLEPTLENDLFEIEREREQPQQVARPNGPVIRGVGAVVRHEQGDGIGVRGIGVERDDLLPSGSRSVIPRWAAACRTTSRSASHREISSVQLRTEEEALALDGEELPQGPDVGDRFAALDSEPIGSTEQLHERRRELEAQVLLHRTQLVIPQGVADLE